MSKAGAYLSGASFSNKTRLEIFFDSNKHSSLFLPRHNDEEKSFMRLPPADPTAVSGVSSPSTRMNRAGTQAKKQKHI